MSEPTPRARGTVRRGATPPVDAGASTGSCTARTGPGGGGGRDDADGGRHGRRTRW